MTRILIDLPDQHIAILNDIAAMDSIPRAEVVRIAITKYVRERAGKAATHAAFGIWKDRNTDGLEYQDELRSEW